MVDGVEVKIPSFFWPLTTFIFFLAIQNPFIKLECEGEHCRSEYISEYDGELYLNWTSTDWMQSNGNLTVEGLTHGYVDCGVECGDCKLSRCSGDEWDYGVMKTLDTTLQDSGYQGLPDFMYNMCSCMDFCDECNYDTNRISLPNPVNQTVGNHVDSRWIDMDCVKMEEDHGVPGSGDICTLVDLYVFAFWMSVGIIVLMVFTQFLMVYLEYVNFNQFLDGNCKFCFCGYWPKKIVFLTLSSTCLGLQLWTFMKIKDETEPALDRYFVAVNEGADNVFVYNWKARGYYLWWATIIGSGITVLSMIVCMPKIERQKKKSYRNDIHGISAESLEARKF